jgi:hypothetical protein
MERRAAAVGPIEMRESAHLINTRQNRTATASIQRGVGGRCNKKGSERTRPNSRNGHVVLSPLSIACLRLRRQGNGEVEAEQQQGLCLLV